MKRMPSPGYAIRYQRPSDMRSVLIVGCGDVGRRVALAERAVGAVVTALARSPASAAQLKALGLRIVHGDLDRPESLVALPTSSALIYYFAPPPATGERDPRLYNFLNAISVQPLPERVVLISTSGVYGDCQGDWVSEDRAPHPDSDRGRRRLDAEQQLQTWSNYTGVPIAILRVPGIYGPGRLPEKRLRAREPVLREAESPWSNRVHILDLVKACIAAGARGRPGAVYNISDGQPSSMTDYFNQVADALGLERPPQISLEQARSDLSAGMQSYLAESKRLDNRRMREELGVLPRYPDLASGLAACLKDKK